jgi:competence protein ComEA
MSIGERISLSRNTFLILLISVAIAFGLGYFVGSKNQANTSPAMVNDGIIDLTNEVKTIKVYICGEVKNPGVYSMTTGDCVLNAVEKAGGFNEKADRKTINLARTLKSGEQIIIQTIIPLGIDSSAPMLKSSVTQYSPKNTSTLININTATKEELMSLPGIGEVKALAIIAYRDKNGLFTDVEELDNVSGIGPKTIETLTPLITVS